MQNLAPAIELAQQYNNVMYHVPDANFIMQLRKSLYSDAIYYEAKLLYENGQQFTNEGINYKNNPGGFDSHVDTTGKLYLTDSLGQAVAWAEVIHIYPLSIEALTKLRDNIWPLVCKDKTLIFHGTSELLVDQLFGSFISGKQVKSLVSIP